jgi:DNA-binding transcriptional regulator YhcF (GntR family)
VRSSAAEGVDFSQSMQPKSGGYTAKRRRGSANRGLGGRIRLSQHSGTPVYIQLADQLKYLIGIGELPPGSRLPSARLLSSNLNINRNTVLSAYAILAAESFVAGHRGGGTLVATPPAEMTEERTSQFNPELLALIDRLVARGASLGLSPDQIAALVASHAHINAQTPRLDVVFVECNPHSVQHYVGEIAREFDGHVVPFLLRDLTDPRTRKALDSADCVVSTFFHLSEVRRTLREIDLHTELVAISVRPHLGVLEQLERLPRGSKVGVAYVSEDSFAAERLRRMTEALEHARLRSIQFRRLLLRGDTDVSAFDGVDALVVRPENFAAVRRVVPEGLAVIEFINELDAASREYLREIFQDLRGRKARPEFSDGRLRRVVHRPRTQALEGRASFQHVDLASPAAHDLQADRGAIGVEPARN